MLNLPKFVQMCLFKEDGIKSPTAIVQPMQNSPTPAVEETLDDVLQKPYSQRATVPLLQDRVNSISEIGKKVGVCCVCLNGV